MYKKMAHKFLRSTINFRACLFELISIAYNQTVGRINDIRRRKRLYRLIKYT